jgi:hypothetical protein
LKQTFWYVPDLWPASTVAILGGGPSLSAEQVSRLHSRVRVIAINDAYRLAPSADLLYFCDDRWYEWHREHLKSWRGLMARLESPKHDFGDPGIRVLKNYGDRGFTPVRDGLMTGSNSGYQALQLAVLLGARRVLLLGYDMRADGARTHWFGDHPEPFRTAPGIYASLMLPRFATLVEPLGQRGVDVINCTPGSALDVFPRATLESVLPDPSPAALPA